jgi:hypothetical protein
MKLVLDNAEFALLLAALKIDSRPFIIDGPLVGLAATELQSRIVNARQMLLDRNLAKIESGRGLAPNAHVSQLIRRATQSPCGFDLVSSSPEQALRIQFSIDAQGVVIHRMLPRGVHVLSEDTRPDAVVDLILEATRLSDAQPEGSGVAYSIKHDIIHSLAAASAAEPGLRHSLSEARMDAATAEAFLRAGLQPTSQGVLTAISRSGSALRAGALSWFADARSLWLMVNPDQAGTATLVNARAADLRGAISAMLGSIHGAA